ncbi:MAG: acetyl-CoA decarbonylase/synthase complex subunit gamma [Actinobacteria bacterium]|nr:acetyl-CoA decarbonylase/synthase complex subunit gamma [Actinomycetota bacterium]
MALTGLEIFKKLPKTNCKDCGFPTCLAFAMKLAAGEISLDACPYVTEAVKMELAEASAPPIRLIRVGTGENAFGVGEEQVLFRHEKRFVNETALGLLFDDSSGDQEIEQKIGQLKSARFERVGKIIKANFAALKNSSKDAARFRALAEKVDSQTSLPLILISDDMNAIAAVLESLSSKKPLIYCATSENIEGMAGLAAKYLCPLVIRSGDLANLSELTEKTKSLGVSDIVIDPAPESLKDALKKMVFLRRSALEKKFRPLGYPTIAFTSDFAKDPQKEAGTAAVLLCKYASIIVLDSMEAWKMFPLLILRQNIFTDPQVPMQVEQKIYPIGDPNEKSPVLITTNFSLTYFIVSGEIEASKVPTWLIVMNVEGQSVLTAWAAGKFIPDKIATFIKKSGISDQVVHRKIIIPGYVAQISGELEEELGEDWKVLVGCREAGDIPRFLQDYVAAN